VFWGLRYWSASVFQTADRTRCFGGCSIYHRIDYWSRLKVRVKVLPIVHFSPPLDLAIKELSVRELPEVLLDEEIAELVIEGVPPVACNLWLIRLSCKLSRMQYVRGRTKG